MPKMGMSLKTLPYLHRPFSPLKSLFSPPPSLSLRSPHPKPFSSSSSLAASSMDPTTIEHVVLFKVRDGTAAAKTDSMLSNLRSLTSLDLASHLTAGPILRLRSSAASALAFTHLLHSRYPSKPDLAAYAAHPSHLSVVSNHVIPICDDIMAVDWVADGHFPIPSPGSALRLTLIKPKEGISAVEVLAIINELKSSVVAGRVEQLSSGENFSPARAKGYTVGFISVCKSVEEMDGLMEDKEAVEAQKEKVRPLIDGLIELDYVISEFTSASL